MGCRHLLPGGVTVASAGRSPKACGAGSAANPACGGASAAGTGADCVRRRKEKSIPIAVMSAAKTAQNDASVLAQAVTN